MADIIKCADCGKILGMADFELEHCEYTPDSEFTTERIEWLCRRCVPETKQDAS